MAKRKMTDDEIVELGLRIMEQNGGKLTRRDLTEACGGGDHGRMSRLLRRIHELYAIREAPVAAVPVVPDAVPEALTKAIEAVVRTAQVLVEDARREEADRARLAEEALRAQHGTEVRRLEAAIERSRSLEAELGDLVSSASEELDGARAEILALRSEIANLDARLQSTLAHAAVEREKLNDACESMRREVRLAEEARRNAEIQGVAAETRASDALEALSATRQELASVHAELISTMRQVAVLSNEAGMRESIEDQLQGLLAAAADMRGPADREGDGREAA